MIMKNGKQIGFIYKNGKKIDKIIRHGKVYFEQGFTREKTSTILPISFDGIGKNLKDYKIYGNSYQDPYNQKNLYDFDTLVTAIYETGGATRQSHLNINYENDTITITSWNNDSYFPGVYNGVSKIEGVNILVTPNTDYTLYYHYDRPGIEKTIIYGINESTQKYIGISSTSPREGERSFNSGSCSEICLRFGTDHDNGNVCTISNIKLLEKSGPSPDYPNEIISCGNKTKNLFNKKDAIYKNGYLKDDNGNEQTTNNSGYLFSYIEVEPNKTYTIQGLLKDTTQQSHLYRLYFYDINKEWILRTAGIGQNPPYTFTTPNNCYFMQFQYRLNVYDEDTIQIEEGSTATILEPYGYKIPININNNIVNIYLNEPLRKINEYSDNIDFKKNKIIRNIGNNILIGNDITLKDVYTNIEYAQTPKPNDYIGYGGYGNDRVFCSHANYKVGSTNWDTTNNIGKIYSGAVKSHFWIGFEKNTGLENIKQKLKNCNIIYPLVTPTEEDIELPNIPTINGNNALNIETEITPSQVYIKYKSNN